MKYTEYLISAKRHSQACRVLKEKIENFDTSEFDTDEYKYLVASLYYLSGYIIECTQKFKIFELAAFDAGIDINEESCTSFGINYKKRIKTHSFEKLQNYLDSLIGEFSYISGEEKVDHLLNNWKPEIRYCHIEFAYSDIQALYNHSMNFLRKV